MHKRIAGLAVALFAVQAQAGSINGLAFVNVPTLDELGLVGLTVIVAIAGGFAARRRRK